jgi:5-formyltetrahydrofolate cyclo-ligase
VFTKAQLRIVVRSKLLSITAEQRAELSSLACDSLRRQPIWTTAKSVLFYAKLPDELDLSPLIDEALASGKTVALPKYIQSAEGYAAFKISHSTQDCVVGKFGIIEPTAACAEFPLNRLDLVLVPGVAFDLTGHRLGRGKGHYDRLLASVTGIKCGVALDEQLVQRIPAEAHDIRMDCVLTPTQFLDFASQ